MNHTSGFQERTPSLTLRGLKKIVTAVVGATALMSAMPAMADTIRFDTLDPTVFMGTETFSEAGYNMLVIDSPAGTGFGFAGAIINGSDPDTCSVAACPVGNSSNSYLGLNDGSLQLSRADNQAFSIHSLDYAFLAPVAGLSSFKAGQLVLTGELANGSGAIHTSVNFLPLVGGTSAFSGYAVDSAFGSANLKSLTISACLFDGAVCSNPNLNQAQFGIDNLNVSAVPEPETYGLMLAGLAAIGLMSRRRAKAAAVSAAASSNIASA